MTTLADRQAFIQNYGAAAQYAAGKIGVPPQYVLGQWALETGWGTQFAGAYNLGNVQGNDPRPRSYKSLAEGVNAYVNVMNLERYSAARQSTNPGEFGINLKMAGYATDPDYAFKIGSVINSVQALAPIVSSTGGGATGGWETNGEGGIDYYPPETPMEFEGSEDSFLSNPLDWFKSKGLNIGFVVLGIGGILLLAYGFATSGAASGGNE